MRSQLVRRIYIASKYFIAFHMNSFFERKWNEGKITHMWRRWSTPHNFYLAFADELWKTKKSKFWKNEKNCWGYHHFTHLYQKPQSYEVQFLRYKEWKNENFKKIKKVPGDIIILHNCTKNNDHRLYCFWDMARDRCNCYFSFWAIFCPFTLLKAQKIKFL